MSRGPDKKPRKKYVMTGVRKAPVFDRVKRCDHCGDDFAQISARNIFCRACAPTGVFAKRIRKYGVGKREFDAMLFEQKGCCAICDKVLDLGQDTHVDHDHVSGRARGLLCNRCNTKLAMFEDKQFVVRATAYLAKCSTPTVDGKVKATCPESHPAL